MNDRRIAARSARGETLVEFALSALMFFMLIFGIIEFGRGVFYYTVIANLSKEGARYAAVHGSSSGDEKNATQIGAYVQSISLGLNPQVSTTWPDSGSPSNAPGKKVKVLVTKNFTPLTSIIPHPTMTLKSSAQLVIAR
jgi:Flp pilus assembly protein TadG